MGTTLLPWSLLNPSFDCPRETQGATSAADYGLLFCVSSSPSFAAFPHLFLSVSLSTGQLHTPLKAQYSVWATLGEACTWLFSVPWFEVLQPILRFSTSYFASDALSACALDPELVKRAHNCRLGHLCKVNGAYSKVSWPGMASVPMHAC